MGKTYLATAEDLQNLEAKIDETFNPFDLTAVHTEVSDFSSDELTVTKGGLNTKERKITT